MSRVFMTVNSFVTRTKNKIKTYYYGHTSWLVKVPNTLWNVAMPSFEQPDVAVTHILSIFDVNYLRRYCARNENPKVV